MLDHERLDPPRAAVQLETLSMAEPALRRGSQGRRPEKRRGLRERAEDRARRQFGAQPRRDGNSRSAVEALEADTVVTIAFIDAEACQMMLAREEPATGQDGEARGRVATRNVYTLVRAVGASPADSD